MRPADIQVSHWLSSKLPTGEKKSLIELTWRAAGKVKNVDDIFIATDDTRIANAVRAFGAKVIMTSSHCRNGTERCAEAVANARLDSNLIINFQGDAPLTPPWFVENLIHAMGEDDKSSMATPVVRLDRVTYGHFLQDRKKDLSVGPLQYLEWINMRCIFPRRLFPL